MTDDYTKGSFLDPELFPQEQEPKSNIKHGFLIVICILIGISFGVNRYFNAAPYRMPTGAQERLTRITIEGCSVDIPTNLVSYTKDNNNVVLESKNPRTYTMLHIYSLEASSVDKLEDDASKLASAIDANASFKVLRRYDNAVFCLVKPTDDTNLMYSYLYFGTNNNTSFYVRVDVSKYKSELRDSVRWSFNTTTDEKKYEKTSQLSFKYDPNSQEYVLSFKDPNSVGEDGMIEFNRHFYMQGYQFDMPDCMWKSKLIDYGYNFEYDYPLTYSFKYLEYKPLNKSGIKSVSDSYISKLSDIKVIDNSWISDNILKLDCIKPNNKQHVIMLFISDDNCCFMQQLTLSEDSYNMLKDNIKTAVANVKKIDWDNTDEPINDAVYFYKHIDDSMYFDNHGSLSKSADGIAANLNKPVNKTGSTHHFPDKDETYNWRDYTDAESFASDHEGEMDYFEALEYYKDMHEKYAEEFE